MSHTYTRTYTYEERAMELALEASAPDMPGEEREQRREVLREWLRDSDMPEESSLRIDTIAAEILLASTTVRRTAMQDARPRPTDG